MKLVDTIRRTGLASCGECGCTSYWVSPSSFNGDCGIDSLSFLVTSATLLPSSAGYIFPGNSMRVNRPRIGVAGETGVRTRRRVGGTSLLVLSRYNGAIELTLSGLPRCLHHVERSAKSPSTQILLSLTHVDPFPHTRFSIYAPLHHRRTSIVRSEPRLAEVAWGSVETTSLWLFRVVL